MQIDQVHEMQQHSACHVILELYAQKNEQFQQMPALSWFDSYLVIRSAE